jgi:hypothetical protein
MDAKENNLNNKKIKKAKKEKFKVTWQTQYARLQIAIKSFSIHLSSRYQILIFSVAYFFS